MAASVAHRNEKVAFTLVGIVAGMTGLAFASAPLYALFCQVTGFGGTTQVATDAPKGVIDRAMTVRFDSNIDPGLAWEVTPSAPVTGQIGTLENITFTATNLTDQPVTGTALFNVVPQKSGYYFNKMECFCFTEQTLAPGETVDMPVSYFIDPEIDQNTDLDTVREITLSYSFSAVPTEGS